MHNPALWFMHLTDASHFISSMKLNMTECHIYDHRTSHPVQFCKGYLSRHVNRHVEDEDRQTSLFTLPSHSINLIPLSPLTIVRSCWPQLNVESSHLSSTKGCDDNLCKYLPSLFSCLIQARRGLCVIPVIYRASSSLTECVVVHSAVVHNIERRL